MLISRSPSKLWVLAQSQDWPQPPALSAMWRSARRVPTRQNRDLRKSVFFREDRAQPKGSTVSSSLQTICNLPGHSACSRKRSFLDSQPLETGYWLWLPRGQSETAGNHPCRCAWCWCVHKADKALGSIMSMQRPTRMLFWVDISFAALIKSSCPFLRTDFFLVVCNISVGCIKRIISPISAKPFLEL